MLKTPEAKQLANKRWRAKNPDYNKTYLKKWREKNPTYMEDWKKDNTERKAYMKAYQREWYLKNRKRLAAEQKIRYAKLDREKVNAYHRKWQKARYAADPAGELLKVHARRTKTTGIKINKTEIHNWESRVCGICSLLIEDKFHIDHIIPLSRGGLHEATNLQLAHPICNWRKNNKLQEEM